MVDLDDPGVQRLLDAPNHAVVSTLNDDGSVHSVVVWADVTDGQIAVNGAAGRRWPGNLDRDPMVTVLVYDEKNPYDYVEVRGRAQRRDDGADAHIDRLAKKYLGVDSYPYRSPDERRLTYLVEPSLVRHQKQG